MTEGAGGHREPTREARGAGTVEAGAQRPFGARHTRRARLPRLLLPMLLLAACLALFFVIAEDVAERRVFAWDTRILQSAADHRTPALTWLMKTVTDLGATLSLTAAALALSALLLWRRLHREALFVLLSLGGAALLNVLLKQLFQRPRPDVVAPVVVAHGFAFPSGHTMSSMAVACAVTLLCWHIRWRYRWVVSAGALAFAVLVGVSRVYLGVHYPSDVLAGWLVSIDLVAVIYLLVFKVRPHRNGGAGRSAGDRAGLTAERPRRQPAPPRGPAATEATTPPETRGHRPGGHHGGQA